MDDAVQKKRAVGVSLTWIIVFDAMPRWPGLTVGLEVAKRPSVPT